MTCHQQHCFELVPAAVERWFAQAVVLRAASGKDRPTTAPEAAARHEATTADGAAGEPQSCAGIGSGSAAIDQQAHRSQPTASVRLRAESSPASNSITSSRSTDRTIHDASTRRMCNSSAVPATPRNEAANRRGGGDQIMGALSRKTAGAACFLSLRVVNAQVVVPFDLTGTVI